MTTCPAHLPRLAYTRRAAPASRGSPWQTVQQPTTGPRQATAIHHWRPS
jgi:hypothetical protein